MEDLISKLMERSSGMATMIGQCLGTNKAVASHINDLLQEREMSDEVRSHLMAILSILNKRVSEVNIQWKELQDKIGNNFNVEPSNN